MARKSEIWFARLKPHRQGGHKCKRYSIDGIRFVLNKGWTRVSERMAEELIEKRSGHAHDAPLLFDIKTAAEADAMDRRERRANKPSRPEESSLIAVGRGDAPDVEDLPIADYGALSVRKVKARLAGLDHEALLEILAYESAHSKRRTLLKAIDEAIRSFDDDRAFDDNDGDGDE